MSALPLATYYIEITSKESAYWYADAKGQYESGNCFVDYDANDSDLWINIQGSISSSFSS